jgi:Tol biopolymer transport system component
MKRAILGLGPFVVLAVAGVLAARCGGDDGTSFDSGPGDTTTDGNPFVPPDTGPTTYSDFPTTPIVDPSLPGNIGQLFGDPDAGAGAPPCVAEPPADAMIPKNWTPLFMEYSSPGANVYEIRLAIDNQQGQAVIYTPNPTYTLDQNLWKQIALHSAGHDIDLSVRGGTLANNQVTNVTAESTSTVHIAPVDAPGSVVYWSSTGGTSFKGFTVGDMTSKTVLTPTTASPASAGAGTVVCISCHTSSPDGTYVFYTRDTGANSRPRAMDVRSVVGANAPAGADVSSSALTLFARSVQGAPVLNANHYSSGDAVALSVYRDETSWPAYQLIWTDLHAATTNDWGTIARTGDPNSGIASPTWSHDGNAIAYVSSSSAGEAVVSQGPAMDIYTVPYNNRAGGTASPLPGASDPNYHEFYPVYSPNDTLLAFNRTPSTCNYGTAASQQCGSSYNQVAAELFVVPAGGGSAQRLRANDPPTCTTLTSPGLTNAWPRWAPQAQPFGSYNFYWLVFSSKRRPATGLNPQLYVSAVVTKVTGNTETIYADYPAVYVLSQDPTQNNHTPAWDNFDVQNIPN